MPPLAARARRRVWRYSVATALLIPGTLEASMSALTRLLLGEVADTPRTRDYQARTDASIAAALARLDAATGLLRPPGEPPTWDTTAGRWGADDGAGLASRGEWLWYYELERGSAALLGRLAWCWRQPLSRYHRAPEVLAAVRRGLQTFAAHQEPDGSFRFCPVQYATCWGTHEMAWRLEPLLYAWAWAGEGLPAEEQAAATAMLERAAAFLAAHPCRDRNNRGAVWSAVMALASHAFGQPAYLAAAQANWAPVRERLFQGGQVMEDTGPDSNYSYTAIAYVYLYRRFAEDDSLDAPLRQAQEWFARMRTLGGVPFEGMSSRVRGGLKSKLDDLLPMLERYTADEPFFATLVVRYLGYMDACGMGSHVNHGCDMRIWAMLEHRPNGPRSAVEPAWFREFGGEYKTDATLYAVIKRGYQGCLTLRGALPLKGWQTWAWGAEPPVIHPGPHHASGTVAWASTAPPCR
jgi:hypothetical protein